MNRKPHIIIHRPNDEKVAAAEARFDIHGTGTTISHRTLVGAPNGNVTSHQRIDLEDSRLQLLHTTIHGIDHWWRPLPGNKDVWELSNEAEETTARFVHSSSRQGSAVSSKNKFPELQVGELQVVDALIGGDEERTEVLCSAVVVVERARRRAGMISNSANAYGIVRSMSASSAGYIPQ